MDDDAVPLALSSMLDPSSSSVTAQPEPLFKDMSKHVPVHKNAPCFCFPGVFLYFSSLQEIYERSIKISTECSLRICLPVHSAAQRGLETPFPSTCAMVFSPQLFSRRDACSLSQLVLRHHLRAFHRSRITSSLAALRAASSCEACLGALDG